MKLQFNLTRDTTNFIKILAATMVMLHHYSQYVLSNGLSSSMIYKLFSTQGGFLGVAIFFFLSGFGLMESEKKEHLGLLNFIKKRVLKVYTPVLLITFIWYFVSALVLPESPFPSYEISIGGGNSLKISNILLNFGDGVLWFIKVILVLYAIFYLFTSVRERNRIIASIVLAIFILTTTFMASIFIASYAAISIPYFALGVGVSLLRERPSQMILTSSGILLLVGAASLLLLEKSLFGHSAINVVCIGIFILLFSITNINIKIPAFFGAISFDLYLVHNKVLATLKNHSDNIHILIFISLTIIGTLLFYILRVKLQERKWSIHRLSPTLLHDREKSS